MTPTGLYYHPEHTWAKLEDNCATVGVTDYAQEQLGDVVFVELPEIGQEVKQGEPVGVIESVKAVSDLHAPLSGKVVETNLDLEDTPEMVNQSPYKEGWIIKIELDDKAELENLLDNSNYEERLSQES